MATFNKDTILGALLVGTYGNSILYTLELVGVTRYYLLAASKRHKDTLPLQAMVYFIFLMDTVSTLATYASVYLYTITHWGDFLYLQTQYWPRAVSLITTGIVGTLVQCFLIYRYWRMSSNNYVTSLLILTMLAALGGCLATTVALLEYTSHNRWDRLSYYVMIWFSTSAATDIAIAFALLWQLNQINSPFKSTRSLIHKIMASTIRTGTVTSVFAVAALILFHTNERSNVSSAFVFCLGRVYALTMLYNLNNRSSLKQGWDAGSTEVNNTTNIMNEFHVTVNCESTTDHGQVALSDRSKDDSDSSSARVKASALPLEV